MSRLLIRDVQVEGRPQQDVLVVDGKIVAIGEKLPSQRNSIDGAGGALIPGLVDHHLHLLAAAAAMDSVDLSGCGDVGAVTRRIGATAEVRPTGAWLRATGCPAAIAATLDRDLLDRCAPRHPLRVQDRTGALWVLNARALAIVGEAPGLERDAVGRATGRVWRGDGWLRNRIVVVAPPLEVLGAQLARFGITGVTDTSATTDASSAALLADARASGALPQRLMLMSGGALETPADRAFTVGAVKIVLDERDPPPLGDLVARIGRARDWGRGVAVHCVTAVELALTLAAFEEAGVRPGDRIEHGGVIPAAAIPPIAAMGLCVVTQPGFVAERGDVYRRDVDKDEQRDLYRCATLIEAGVAVAGSSDAPYGPADCWTAMRAAVARRTRRGAMLGAEERIAPAAALGLYLGTQHDPGGPARRVMPGTVADLCLLKVGLGDALYALDVGNVAATIIGGTVVWRAS